MRTNELVVSTRVIPILESINLCKNSEGYLPLVDFIVYAGVNPDVSFDDIFTYLEGNHYMRIRAGHEKTKETMCQIMAETVQSALELGNQAALSRAELSEGKEVLRALEKAHKQTELLKVLGEKYESYSHDEIVVYYFTKKILRAVTKVQIEEALERMNSWTNPKTDEVKEQFDEISKTIFQRTRNEGIEFLTTSEEEIEAYVKNF